MSCLMSSALQGDAMLNDATAINDIAQFSHVVLCLFHVSPELRYRIAFPMNPVFGSDLSDLRSHCE